MFPTDLQALANGIHANLLYTFSIRLLPPIYFRQKTHGFPPKAEVGGSRFDLPPPNTSAAYLRHETHGFLGKAEVGGSRLPFTSAIWRK